MNVLFLTLGHLYDLKASDIYTDLMREFIRNGHEIFIVTPYERSLGKDTEIYSSDGAKILGVKTLNIQKASIIEKFLGTLLIGRQFKRAIQEYLGDVTIDLVTYSTPPITLAGVVKYVKKKYGSKSYLQLKDIFPQNAVDLGLIGKGSLIYKYFRDKEEKLYDISDHIGCMSPANIEYVLKHNKWISPDRVHLCPNSIELWPHIEIDIEVVRKSVGLPVDKPIFLYGGNLGKPQGIDFLVKCLDEVKGRTDCHFLILGSGTEAYKVDEWIERKRPTNVTKMDFLPKADYYNIVASCDIGLVFLDYRFTIPNFPSRLLPYFEYKMPVICATDVNTDMGRIVEESGLGYWCESKNTESFVSCIDKILSTDYKQKGQRAYKFLCDNYLVEHTYEAITKYV